MKKVILTLFPLICAFFTLVNAQEDVKNNAILFNLYENASDQDGMFYFPEIRKDSFSNGFKQSDEKNYKKAVQNGEAESIVKMASGLAWVEHDQENYQKAITYMADAILNQNKIEKGSAGRLHLQLGFFHYRSLDYEAALSDFKQALDELELQNDKYAVPVAHALIAQTNLVQKDFDNADKNFKEAYDGFATIQNLNAGARMAMQLGEIAIRKSDDEIAENYLNEAMSFFQNNNENIGLAIVHRDFGILNYKKGNYEEAIADFKKSLTYSNQLSVAKLLKNTYLKLYMLKSLFGEHDASNSFNILYVQLRDSVDAVESSRIVNSRFTRYELMEKETVAEMLRKETTFSYQSLTPQELKKNRLITEAEIERLEKEKIIEDLNMAKRLSDQANIEREERIQLLTREKSLQDLALSKQELEVSRAETFKNTLIMTVIFIIIIVVLLYNRYRNKSKSHQQIDKAYKELSDTHNKLLSTQEQLVHAQKMASLGQLTAGIAHEIQNPLNFVNNFSELSIELIDEMKEPDAEVDQILVDLGANLKKINTHGKRADKIVKGMLLHSRAGEVQKEPADLNVMIDELLELSYHGNRSRDHSFTCETIRNFDPKLSDIQVVTQDISRVLINLFNNAFYAVGERAKKEGSKYKASVGVSTKMENDEVVIKIRDNGTGIPMEVRNKIFDPFFTTKPAGEGTGLGLSLSYDVIVKGHNGSLVVNSEPNSFTEFIIKLPAN